MRPSLLTSFAIAAVLTFGVFTGVSAATPAGPLPLPPAGAHATGPTPGYWLLGEDGGVFSFGGAAFHGSMANQPLAQPTVCMSSAADGNGYWLLGADGGVFSFGDAGFYGSAAVLSLRKPVVGMAGVPAGNGYWLVASDGGVFSFGHAGFYGSAGGKALNAPIVGMTPTPAGNGYWLLGADGGVFSFGDAGFYGSAGGKALNAPIMGMASTADGNGYWLVASDGGVFSFGDAGFYGSAGGKALNAPIVGMSPSTDGQGYWLASQDGGVLSFGDAGFYGSLGGTTLDAPVVALAAVGQAGGCQGTAVPVALPVPASGGPAGEGRWVPSGRFAGSTPAIYTTTLRPYGGGDPAGIAWIDTSRATLRLYAGPPSQPPGSYAASSDVAPSDRAGLLAAFNSGFQMVDSHGGWYSEGQMPVPLRNGAASLVIGTNGSVRIGMWGRDFTLAPDVYSVRQNLNMLVDGGKLAGDIFVGGDWGAVVGGIGNDWRSGIGIDRYGHLIYVAGPDLYPVDLAHLLIAAGSVEAMELDINPQFPVFSTYVTAPGQSNPSVVTGWDLIGGMYYGPNHFVSTTNRDFFGVLKK